MKLSFKYVVPRNARREKVIIEDKSKVYNTLLGDISVCEICENITI